MEISTWIRGARLKTLPLAIAPVVIGAALSWRGVFLYSQGGDIWHEPCPFFGGQHDLGKMKFGSLVGECQRSAGWFILVAVLCGCVALFLQVAANFANDYSDGIRGTDEGRAVDSARSFAKTPSAESTSTPEMLPASQPQHGPARLVASGVSPKKVLAAAGINALIACLCGLAVVALTGYWWFILVGIACLVAGWCYVGGKHPYGYHYLGEIFVLVFFGLVATCGTMFALAGTISTEGMLGGANVGLIAVAVLCVNNLRDVETDRTHGKHTWMTALGRRNGTVLRLRCCPSPCCCSPLIYCCCRRLRCRQSQYWRSRARCALPLPSRSQEKIRRGAAAVHVLLTGARRNVRVLRGVCLALQRQCNEMKIVAKRGASIVGNGLFWVCQAVDLQA